MIKSLYSNLLRKAIVFPQMLKAHRHVMCSAITKQSCDLGHDGEFNQLQLLLANDTEHIPEIPGRNILLGIMDWNGYTHEDACVISESLAHKMITYSCKRQVITSLSSPKLLVKEGDWIKPRIPIAETVRPKLFHGRNVEEILEDVVLEKDDTLLWGAKINVPGTVESIRQWTEAIRDITVYHIEIYYKVKYRCEVGSKLSNLHSAKCIVSKILPDNRMPLMKDGIPLEMLISPMCIGNRVNPSLVMECMLGMYLKQIGEDHNIDTPRMIISPFDRDMTFHKAAHYLQSIGLPENCQFRLKNGTKGHIFPYSTLVGYVFVMLLHHHNEDKLKDANHQNTDFTGKAQRGVGNQRYSREEFEILIQHGADNVIEEAKNLNRKLTTINQLKELVKVLGYEYC